MKYVLANCPVAMWLYPQQASALYAKARKKAAQRLKKAVKKAEGVTRTTELTERKKAQQVGKLMRRGWQEEETGGQSGRREGCPQRLG